MLRLQQAVCEMSSLVDQGSFAEARHTACMRLFPILCFRGHAVLQAAHVGNSAEVQLGVDTQSVTLKDKISHGTQSTVYNGSYSGNDVAVKKAKISKSSDLDNFKLEIIIMADLRHVTNVISLLAARLLPPGASLQVHNCPCC